MASTDRCLLGGKQPIIGGFPLQRASDINISHYLSYADIVGYVSYLFMQNELKVCVADNVFSAGR